MPNGLTSAEVSDEIEGSIADLETLELGWPSFLARACGEHDLATKRGAAAARLPGAFTTKPGIARAGGEPYAIPRIEILRDDRAVWFV